MAQYDIYDTFVSYQDDPGSKVRPVLLITVSEIGKPTYALAIYSYKKKHHNLFYSERFYHIQNAGQAGLSKDSFVDVTRLIDLSYLELLQASYRGRLSEVDIAGLKAHVQKIQDDQKMKSFKIKRFLGKCDIIEIT